ncbi:Growth hormone-regulated TBC protein 6 [Diplonema papillatum]|nr:Growth hormone-regulated TBC protein 6 [Diplonema papillatum]
MSEKLDDAGDDAEDLRQRLTEAITAAGVPEEERPSVWFAVTGAFRAREAAEQPSFADAGTRTAPAESLATIKKDMGRTFPMCDAFDEGRPARKELHGVLSAFAATDPGGYCQGLNFIAGLLLLYVSADQAYHILHRIASHERYNRGYYGLAMEMCHRDLAVLHTLVQAHHGAVLEKFEADHLSLTDLFIRWYLTLFIDCFPLQTVLQLWDVYFAAGIPFIFSLILAFIDTHRDLIMAADGLGPTLLAVKNEALRTVDPSALISLALEKYPLSLSELLSMRTEAEATLAEQQREQQEKRDAFNKKRAEKDRQTGEEDASPRARIKGMLSFSRKKK